MNSVEQAAPSASFELFSFTMKIGGGRVKIGGGREAGGGGGGGGKVRSDAVELVDFASLVVSSEDCVTRGPAASVERLAFVTLVLVPPIDVVVV